MIIEKKYILIGAIILSLSVVLILVYLFFRSTSTVGSLQVANFEGADVKEQSDSGIVWNTSSGPVRINNIFENIIRQDEEVMVLRSATEFSISYVIQGDFIEVILLSQPYSGSRAKAEQVLGNLLGAGSEICKLPIEVYTQTEIADEFRPGGEINYGLSTCPGAVNIGDL
ncbi:TPA: hypothetical protein DCG61_00090 [Patescibacteria group bacterium]|nr:hypothetical protein [Patescibacteria group bacterium]